MQGPSQATRHVACMRFWHREVTTLSSPKSPTLEEFRARAALTGLTADARGHRASAQGLCRLAQFDGAHPHPLGLGRRAAANLPRRRIEAAMTDLTLLGIAEAGRLMARGEITSTAAHRGVPETHRGRGSQDRELHHRHRRSGAQRGTPGRHGDEGRPAPRTDARHPGRAEGHLRDRGHDDDRPFASRKDYVPAIDAETVRRLKDAGAVILGKLGTHEFANGAMTPDQPFPAVRNPWNTDYQPGGSSSGSGAAVAAAALHGRDGLRHRRLDPQSGGLLRHRRHQADLRAGQPLRHLPAHLQLRHRGPARLDDRRLRADARRAGGLRSQRPGLGQGGEGRLRRRGATADQGHAHRAGAQLVRGQGRRHARDEEGHRRGGARAEGSRRDGRGRRLPRHPRLSHLRPRHHHGRGARDPSPGGDRDAGEVRLHDAPALPARRLPHRRAVSLRAALPPPAHATRARRCAATTW